MEASFWQQRWEAGQIGFHEGRANALLTRFIDRLPPGGRVLVPLCGKSEDLAFLAARGHQVIGVELVETAAAAFFAEHDTTPTITTLDGLRVYRHGAITIVVGDLFATTAAHLAAIDAIYDRAAMIALPPDLRRRYVTHLRALAPSAPRLLIGFEYPQAAMDGPPFAVLEPEVRALHPDATITVLADEPAIAPRLAALGLTARERCYWIA